MRALARLVPLIVASSLSACGGSTSTEKLRGNRSRAGPTVPSSLETTASAAEPASHEGPGTAPNEIGRRLGGAEADLLRRGIRYRVKGRTAGEEPQALVCETNPAPRSHLESGTVLYLVVGSSC